MPIAVPPHLLVSLQELASGVLDRRAVDCDSGILAADLLAGFFDACMRTGLDGVVVELEQAFTPLDITDGAALAEDPRLRAALVERLDNKAEFDPGGPRNAKPGQLADCLAAVLSLVVSDEPSRTVTFADEVRAEVVAEMTSVIEAALAMPEIRTTIITIARSACEPRHLAAFDKIAAQLDETGMRMIRQPKVALDAVQAIQATLFETRKAVVEKAAHVAIDRAKQVLARSDAEAAARIEQPISHKLTPRDVAVGRASDARVPKVPAMVVQALFDGLSELANLAWRPLAQPVRKYAASQTFAVGDLLEHPKFGRGSVLTTAIQRIEVEFPEGKHTLVHARAK